MLMTQIELSIAINQTVNHQSIGEHLDKTCQYAKSVKQNTYRIRSQYSIYSSTEPYTVKPVFSGHSKSRHNKGFNDK